MDYQSSSANDQANSGGKSSEKEGIKQLLILSAKGELFAVQSLMRKLDAQEGFDVDRMGDFHLGPTTIEGTAPMAAAAGGFTGIVHYLVEHCQASPTKHNTLGANALMLAASSGHVETVSYLVGLPGTNCDHQDKFDQTALMIAATEGHLAVVKTLVDSGCDVHLATGEKSRHAGLGPLELAAAANALPVAEFLLEREADLDNITKDGWDSLYLASERGHFQMVKLLLSNNADVNAASDEFEGLNALGASASKGHDPVVKELLANQAHIETDVMTSAVVRSADAGRLSTLEMLLNEPVIKVAEGAPPPHHSKVFEALLARMDYQDDRMDGATPLIRAARNGHYEAVEMLLNKRASIDGLDKSGEHSALLLAAENEHSDCVRLLVSKGADVHLGRADDGGSSAIKQTTWAGVGAKEKEAGMLTGTPMYYALNSPALAEAFMDGLRVRFEALGQPNCPNERFQLRMFKRIFTPEFVSKCLGLKGPAAVKCLDIIFRRPVPTATCMRLPVRSYMASSLRTSLRKDFFRPDPGADLEELIMEDDGGNSGAKQVPVTISCFYVPGFVCDDVLYSLAVTPNSEIYRTTPVQAIIDIVWQAHGLRSSMHQLALELLLVISLCLATHLTVEDKDGCDEHIFGIGGDLSNKHAGHVRRVASAVEAETSDASLSVLWVTLMLMFVISLREFRQEVQEATYLISRGIVVEYFSDVGVALAWLRILLTLLLLPFLMFGLEVPVLLAIVAFLRWLKLLHCLNGFQRFGPRILPIMGTFQAMLPFCVVISFYIAAFSHAGWALHVCEPIQQVYRLSMLGEFDLRTVVTAGDDQEVWQNLWFVICSFFMSVALLNVFIGVMSESYDRHQDASTMTFLKHRANINLRCFLRAHRSGANSETSIVNARTKLKLNFHEAVVWVCHTAKDADDFAADFEGRIAVLKRHTEEQATALSRNLDQLRLEIGQATEGFHSLEGCHEDLNRLLQMSVGGRQQRTSKTDDDEESEADGEQTGSGPEMQDYSQAGQEIGCTLFNVSDRKSDESQVSDPQSSSGVGLYPPSAGSAPVKSLAITKNF